MATSKEFCGYISDNLLAAGDVSFRRMMGEYCVYYRGKVIGLICDNCFMVKMTPGSERLLHGAERGYPYEGSKTLMLMVDCVEDTPLMAELLDTLYLELPDTKPKKKKAAQI